MKKMKDVPVRDRPREKIVRRGVSALSDTELIEAIIGRGTKNKDVRTLAKEICGLIQKHRQKIRYEDLEEIEGLGPVKASQITACFELSRRYFPTGGQDTTVTKPEDILPHVAYLKDKRTGTFRLYYPEWCRRGAWHQDDNTGSP
jgi:DNA repair proteins